MNKIKYLLLMFAAGGVLTLPLLAEENDFFVKRLEDEKTKDVVFSTSYGDIPKGSSMAAVMGILGNPQGIVSKNNKEIWFYRFDQDNSFLVYFTQEVVVEVKAQKDLGQD